MASIAYNGVPANVKFQNVTKKVAISDPGAKVRGVDHKNTDVKVQLFQLNSYINIATGDDVTIRVETSEELAYYKSLENENLVVTATPISQ